MSKILVCGATGFMGRNSVEYFKKLGHEVHATNFTRDPYESDGVVWHHVNLLESKEVNKLFENNFDIVIQAAAATSGCKDTLLDPALHISANAIMNSLIFRAVTLTKVKHLIFPSCSVMYQSNTEALKETDFDANTPLNPAYLGFASTKLYCEKLCEFYSDVSDTKFTVMRNTNFYGPYDKFDLNKSHVFGATITKVMSASDGDVIKVWGTGNEARDFLHIDNFCRFAELAIEKQPTKCALYNVGSGVAVTINNLVQTVIDISGKQLTIEHDLSKPTIPTSFYLDTSKAKEQLGWELQGTLEDGVKRTIDYWVRK